MTVIRPLQLQELAAQLRKEFEQRQNEALWRQYLMVARQDQLWLQYQWQMHVFMTAYQQQLRIAMLRQSLMQQSLMQPANCPPPIPGLSSRERQRLPSLTNSPPAPAGILLRDNVGELFLDDGKERAEYLQRIITYHPDTEMAREARRLLEQAGTPMEAPKLGLLRSNPQP